MPGGGEDPARLASKDEWSIRGDYIVRVHHVPRIALFVPTEAVDPPSIPLDSIDVMRVTTTGSDNVDEMKIEDVWDGKSPNDHRPLSCRWVGETRFERVRDGAAPGHYFVGGRETRRQTSKRPDNVWPEIWSAMPRKQKERAVETWEAKRVAIGKARAVRASPPAPCAGDESDEDDAPQSHSACAPGIAATVRGGASSVPAMPVSHEPETPQPHREQIETDLVGQLALVTRQLTPSELRNNPSAMQKLDEEWDKLARMKTWDASAVCEYEAARKRALEQGRVAHFGRLFGFSSESIMIYLLQNKNTRDELSSRATTSRTPKAWQQSSPSSAPPRA